MDARSFLRSQPSVSPDAKLAGKVPISPGPVRALLAQPIKKSHLELAAGPPRFCHFTSCSTALSLITDLSVPCPIISCYIITRAALTSGKPLGTSFIANMRLLLKKCLGNLFKYAQRRHKMWLVPHSVCCECVCVIVAPAKYERVCVCLQDGIV